jgi:adenosylcobinamide amidohydrolase
VRIGDTYDGLELHRSGRVLYARFDAPHRVLSTCRASGGTREDLDVVFNHQVCEPTGHCHGSPAVEDPATALRDACRRHGLPEGSSAMLATAANMRCAGVSRRQFRDLVVVAACTAGVEGNAGRAGDPAGHFEWDGVYERVAPTTSPRVGTINTMLFISHELTPGTMVQALITATEAKSAVLQEYVVGSRYSQGRATGTGTDQSAVACRTGTGTPLTGAGKHGVLGQLIGEGVAEAVRDSLVLQNGMTPPSRRSLLCQLERFGVTWRGCCAAARELLDDQEATLFESNRLPIDTDPLVVAAAAALGEVVDQYRAGILPKSCGGELAATYGAQLARAVAGSQKAEVPDDLMERFAEVDLDPAALVPVALARGFRVKWSTTPDGRDLA